jgi:hypothetical protein
MTTEKTPTANAVLVYYTGGCVFKEEPTPEELMSAWERSTSLAKYWMNRLHGTPPEEVADIPEWLRQIRENRLEELKQIFQ